VGFGQGLAGWHLDVQLAGWHLDVQLQQATLGAIHQPYFMRTQAEGIGPRPRHLHRIRGLFFSRYKVDFDFDQARNSLSHFRPNSTSNSFGLVSSRIGINLHI